MTLEYGSAEEEIKEYHRKKLYKASLKSAQEKPQLDEPTDEQKEWVLFRLTHDSSWPRVHDNKIGDVEN